MTEPSSIDPMADLAEAVADPPYILQPSGALATEGTELDSPAPNR